MTKINLDLIKISDRLYYMPHYEQNDWCTIGLVIGDHHTMMLDSGASSRHVELFLQQLRRHHLPAPDLCALTHWHWDHTYGLAHLKNVTSFATAKTNNYLRQMQTWSWTEEAMQKRIQTGEDLAFSYPHINDEYPDKSQIRIASASVLYTDELTIDLGGRTVVLKAIENSHSDDCAIAYIPEESCIFLGDIHYEDLQPEPPVYYADKHQLLLDGLKKFSFNKVLSGHQLMMSDRMLYEELLSIQTVSQ